MSHASLLTCALLAPAFAAAAQAQECETLALVADVGAGTPGSAGVPELHTLGQPMVNQPGMGLRITGGAPGAPAQLVVGSPGNPQFLPAYGARLYPGPPFVRFPLTLGSDGSSPAVQSGPAATSPALCGLEFVAQGVVSDPAAQGGLAFTGGVRLRFGVGSAAASLFDGACFFTSQSVLPGVRALASGDMNGDGRIDVVVADGPYSEPGTVTVLLQLPDGSLWAATHSPTGVEGFWARDLVLTDLDDDGALDVAIAYDKAGGPHGLSLLRGHGDGTFDAPLDLPAKPEGRPIAIEAADLDADGLPELVVAHWGDKTVGVLANHGGMSFTTSAELPLGGAAIERNLRLADVTGDGALDIVLPRMVPGIFPTELVILPSLGGLAFGAGQVIDTEFNSILGLATGDVDADGDTDVVVVARDDFTPTGVEQGVRLYENLGSAQFAEAVDVDGSDYFAASDVALADLDDDGLPELVYGELFVYVRPNLGGSFGPGARFWARSELLTVADMDGDGHPDVLTADGTWVRWLRGLGGVSFAYPSGTYADTPYDYEPVWTTADDLDADGVSDLVFSSPFNNDNWFSVRLGTGAGSFGPSTQYTSASNVYSPPALVDLDADGNLDVVAGCLNASTIAVHRGAGDGTLGPPEFSPVANLGVGTPRAADLDGDGDLDLVVGSNPNGIRVLLGAGDGTLLPAQSVPATAYQLIGVGDVDADGPPDIVFATPPVQGTPKVRVLHGVGDGTFTAGPEFAMPDSGGLTTSCIADVDLDGHIDLVLVFSQGLLSVHRGAGDGTFTLTHATLARFDRGVAVADINGDGAPDIVGLGAAINGLMLGFGDGTFAAVQPGGAGGAVGDFDGDGDPDTASWGLVFLSTLD